MVNTPQSIEPQVMSFLREPMRSDSVPKNSAENVVALAEHIVIAVTTPSWAPKSEYKKFANQLFSMTHAICAEKPMTKSSVQLRAPMPPLCSFADFPISLSSCAYL